MAVAASIDQKFRLSLRSWLALALIAAAVVAGGVARGEAIGASSRVSADEHGYVANANRILAGRRYATFKWPPGTSLVFAAAAGAAGRGSLRATPHARGPAQYAQLALGVLTLALVAALAWAAAGPWPALGATALVASYMPLVLATRTFLSEPAGGLALLAALGAAAWARSHRPAALAGAGAVGGLACLVRGDLTVGMAALALALALAGRPGWRVGAMRGGAYLAGLALALAPWLAYASATEGRFVPITTAGPDAFFVGTYLPGKGLLVPTEEALAPQVCRRFPKDCGPYWQRSSEPLFALIRARHPRSSATAAVTQADIENVRRYALGQPLAFASMLRGKFWNMWGTVWGGGNSAFHPETSRLQHLLYLTLAWLGLLGGAMLTRRWLLVASAAVLLGVSALATLFNDQSRYNVSLMPLLLSSGAVGLWLAGERVVAAVRGRARAGAGG
jgi:hypothetical protein